MGETSVKQAFLVALLSTVSYAVGQSLDPEIEWLQSPQGDQYIIHYVQEYEEDLEFVRKWLDHAFEVGREKYGVSQTPCPLNVFLYPPESTPILSGRVSIGHVGWSECSQTRDARLHYFTPSIGLVFSEQNPRRLTSIGLPWGGEDYQAKLLIHEAMNFILWAAREQRSNRQSPR